MSLYYPSTVFPHTFISDSSALLSGGVLSAFLAGTSTPTMMYLDADGTNAGTTITLNARGEPEVSGDVIVIYLKKGIDYKFTLVTAAAEAVWTVDSYSGPIADVYLYLSSYASLSAAVTAIGATESTLIIDKDDTVSTTVTVPTTLALQPMNGNVLTYSGTLTINGPVLGAPVFHWLTKSGSGTLSFGQGATPQLCPEWFYSTGGYETAINTAIAVQFTSIKIVNGMASIGSIIPVNCQPNKQYIIAGSIVGTSYLSLHGINSSICTSSAFPFDQTYQVVTDIGYDPKISGLRFFGGTDVLVFPEDASSFDILLDDLKFQEYSGTAILGSTVAHAQHLVCKNSFFYPRSITAKVADISFDSAVFEDCTVNGPSTTFFVNRDNMTITRMFGAPALPIIAGEAHSISPRWVHNTSTAVTLTIDNCRFGGEPGARRILENDAPYSGSQPTSIIIKDSETYVTDDIVMQLNELPNQLIFKGNHGLVGAAPIGYANFSQNTQDNIGKCDIQIEGGDAPLGYGSIDSTDGGGIEATKIAVVMNRNRRTGTATIATAAKIADVVYGSLGGAVAASFTVTTSTDLFGATTQKITGDDIVSNFANLFIAGALTGKAAGIYTIVVNLKIYGTHPVRVRLNGSGSEEYFNLYFGDHTLNHTFYFDGTNGVNVGYDVYQVNLTSIFEHGGYRLFSGDVVVNDWNTITYADAAPSTIYHRLGDVVHRLTPVVGQPVGWRCTVAGTPGTWVALANL